VGQRQLNPVPLTLGNRNVSRCQNCRFFGNVEDGDGIALDLEENPEVSGGPHDLNTRHALKWVGPLPDSLIAVPVPQVI
jgi:hypothetical protein